jgi:Tannase and feruloyl esterase
MTVSQMILALAALSAVCPVRAQQACEGLGSLPLHGVTIISAASVPAGSFTLPGNASAAAVQIPAFCRVIATVNKEVRMELWMPQQWNHKLLGVGNGGLAGSISYLPMVKPLQQGYATSSTDTGHQGNGTDG